MELNQLFNELEVVGLMSTYVSIKKCPVFPLFLGQRFLFDQGVCFGLVTSIYQNDDAACWAGKEHYLNPKVGNSRNRTKPSEVHWVLRTSPNLIMPLDK